jgi:hypothetical protein
MFDPAARYALSQALDGAASKCFIDINEPNV